jgi:hypothetical protein
MLGAGLAEPLNPEPFPGAAVFDLVDEELGI